MRNKTTRRLAAFAMVLAGILLAFADAARAQSNNPVIYAVTTDNRLIRFSATAPGTLVGTNRVLSGLAVGENIVGMDFRPRTGQLYALSSASRLYIVNIDSNSLTPVGSAGAFTLNGTDFGFDFNPSVDRIRVVSNTGQNLRLNPDTGALAATDTNLAYASGDANAAATPNVSGAAYTNNVAATTATTLYDIDTNLDILVTQNPPNAGTLNTVGPLGLNATGPVAFDIASGTGLAYAAIDVAGGDVRSNLYTINLATGAATLVGAINHRSVIRDLSVLSGAAPDAYGVTASNSLVRFNTATPGTVATIGTITGLQTLETIQGLDFRPLTATLYALGSSNRIYSISTTDATATPVGTASLFALVGTAFGTDFNPIPDRLRVVSDADQNLRLNAIDGTLTALDTNLAYATGDANFAANPNIVGAGYVNNYSGTTATTLYGIDSTLDILVTQNPPNAGTLNTVGPLGFNTTDQADLDVSFPNNVAYAVLTAPAATNSGLYSINLTTGAATLIGNIGGAVLRDFAVVTTNGALAIDHPNIPSCRDTEYGTLTLNAPAPATGTVVTFTTTNSAITVPASLTVPAGASTLRFSYGVATPANAMQGGKITATYNGISKEFIVKALPRRLSNYALSATSIRGGNPVTGTVTLDCVAPTGGIVVTLTSSNAAATPPATVTIPAGQSSATFTIPTLAVTRSTGVNLRATATDFTRGIILTLTPPSSGITTDKGEKSADID